jgi:anaerobic magnesium-protoporphyrin IX monomethyl ester cyclase
MTDLLLITPNNSSKTYQSLNEKYSAIEPPTWALLLAESCRSKGYSVKILDTLAESLSDENSLEIIKSINPSIICFVVYGQNVNAGTTNMSGAVRLANFLKDNGVETQVGFIGSHVQALPKETLENETAIDFVFLNEGVYSLHDILDKRAFSSKQLEDVLGLAVKTNNGILFTGPPRVVPQDKLDIDLPGYAWDLLPYKNTPLDLYRSPFWHAQYKDNLRTPYAAIQTSIGCQFKCSFCMINLINKNDTSEISKASDYNGMRHWSLDIVEKELLKLIKMGVKTIRITDEMFLLNKKFYMPIIDLLVDLNKNDDLYIWAYSRIDTVPHPEILEKLRKAGMRWLCLGIESGHKSIRLEVAKGKFEEVDVEKVVRHVENAGIHVMANYIFGLPGDTEETIEQTYQLSAKLNTLGWNTYAAMALPGSPLYVEARSKGVTLPEKYEEFSFHAYETIPLPTERLTAARILQLRDEKFTEYFNRSEFLDKINNNFGRRAVENIIEMNKIKLKRKIIEDIYCED